MLGFGLCIGLCAAASCAQPAGPGVNSSPPFAVGGTFSGIGGGAGFAGGEPACVRANAVNPVFADQVLSSSVLFGRELYAWTTDEQGLALRRDQVLFSQAAGDGAPFTMLRALQNATADESALALQLSQSFAMGRYAWPEPWATRMGSPGQDPGGQLVRIVLKSDAWLAILRGGSISVFDAQRRPVAAAGALAHPEQIGAIFFDSSFAPYGPCTGPGQREFLLGNLAMVEEWSLGTQVIADRVRANIEQLTNFLNNTRRCPVTSDASAWEAGVFCSWQSELAMSAGGANGSAPSSAGGAAGASDVPAAAAGAGGAGGVGFDPAHFGGLSQTGTEEFAYEQALSLPNANYLAAPEQIAAIIEALTGDLFEPDPLVVAPGSP